MSSANYNNNNSNNKIDRKRISKKYKSVDTKKSDDKNNNEKEKLPLRKSVTVKVPSRKLPNVASIGDEDHIFKVMILGDSGVGKTCIILKFRDNVFLSGNYISTVGIDFKNKVVNVDGSKVKLQIWDTAGQERFRSVTHAYYRDAHALLLLYDVTSRSSFDNTRAWLSEIKEYAQDDVVIMLLGNKADCRYAERTIRKEDGEKLAKEYSVAFMETSAKSGQNVDLAFMAIAKQLLSKHNEEFDKSSFNVNDYIKEQTQRTSCACSI